MRRKDALAHGLGIVICAALGAGAAGFCAADIADINIDLSGLETRGVSMDFKGASLNDVLKIFSQQSGMNFIAASDIADKTVDLYLDNVPVDEALERILSANGLTYEIEPQSRIFIVKKLDVPERILMTRVYPLRHATVPSSKLNETLGGSSASEDESSSVLSTTSTTSSSDKGSGIISAVKAVLTSAGTVVEDPRTNSLIVTDIPGQFLLIEQTIARLDIKIAQILIEVEMLDISKGAADLIGFKYGDTPMTFHGGERDSIYPFDINAALRKGYEFEDPEYRVSTLSFDGLTVALQFLRTQTDTKNLARPRILTLNNETAEIQIKTDEAIGLASSTTSTEGTASSIEEAERVETGVFLKVTPQANIETNEITMAIEPKVIQARTGATFSTSEGPQTFKDPEERGTKSVLRVKDGDTIILGGLLRTDVQEIKTKVPVLGDMPFFGSVFRHTDRMESERELIIFITPHIVQENFDFAETSKAKISKVVREQNIPPKRLKAIEKELAVIEQQGL